MDEGVLKAMARWPNVPAVFGWLSLTARGQWRLHPNGDATNGSSGESISNPQILRFIARNYHADELGRWYFQNGPQRVFVRLDAAPLVISVDDHNGLFTTHTEQQVESIERWWITDEGNLYALTDKGPGIIIDRDLMRLVDRLQTSTNQSLSQWWLNSSENHTAVHLTDPQFKCCRTTVKLIRLATGANIADEMAFVANPTATTTN